MTDWNRRPEVIDAEERYGDHSEWERSLDERDAFLHDEAFARDPDERDRPMSAARDCPHCNGGFKQLPNSLEMEECERCEGEGELPNIMASGGDPEACPHCGGPLTTGPTGFVECEGCNPSPWRAGW